MTAIFKKTVQGDVICITVCKQLGLKADKCSVN